MRRSIRWSLIAWFALLLVVVLATFGSLLYGEAARAAEAGVDGVLEGQARAVLGALDLDEDDGWELDLSGEYLRGLTAGGYYAVFDGDGRPLQAGGTDAPARPTGVAGARDRGTLREVELAGPQGTRVVVGRSVEAERQRLAALRVAIIGSGVGILLLALLGGWWLARRSVAPIEAMAATAEGISERDLSARLDATRVPTELSGLAEAFNSTLGRLEAAFVRQARFTADASHELRTPVSIIRTQAEVALTRERSTAEYRAALEACLKAAERMTGVVEGLLMLARTDAGKVGPAKETVALAPLVHQATELLRPEAEAGGVTIDCAIAPAAVRGDGALLGEVVSNLVSNAVRYNRAGGRVDVSLGTRNGEVELRVADTGIGIPAEAVPHLFDRFFRVDPARSREQGGSGLGLAITRWIVEAHGGTIDVISREREGSTFTVRLPAAPAA
ncbi:MAG: heavy metal sensor histidine kinase [Planctomycetota bacterium]|jgi:heavy metal sensor kinase